MLSSRHGAPAEDPDLPPAESVAGLVAFVERADSRVFRAC
jgi:hypothetical protein